MNHHPEPAERCSARGIERHPIGAHNDLALAQRVFAALRQQNDTRALSWASVVAALKFRRDARRSPGRA